MSRRYSGPLRCCPPSGTGGNKDLTSSRGRTAKQPSQVANVLSQVCNTYPYDPGVHRAKHGAPAQDPLTDFSHVVQQPAELHRTEVSADGKACLGLERDRPEQDVHWQSHCETHTHTLLFLFFLQTFRWFLSFPGALLMRLSTVDCVRRSNQTTEKSGFKYQQDQKTIKNHSFHWL